MGKTAAERQKDRRERLRAEGKKQLLVTLDPEAMQALNEQCETLAADYSTVINQLLKKTSGIKSDSDQKKKNKKGKTKSFSIPGVDFNNPNQGAVAVRYARMATADLAMIQRTHYDREEAFDMVLDWIKNNRD